MTIILSMHYKDDLYLPLFTAKLHTQRRLHFHFKKKSFNLCKIQTLRSFKLFSVYTLREKCSCVYSVEPIQLYKNISMCICTCTYFHTLRYCYQNLFRYSYTITLLTSIHVLPRRWIHVDLTTQCYQIKH